MLFGHGFNGLKKNRLFLLSFFYKKKQGVCFFSKRAKMLAMGNIITCSRIAAKLSVETFSWGWQLFYSHNSFWQKKYWAKVCENRFGITKAFFEVFRKFCLFAFEEKISKYSVSSEIVELANWFFIGFLTWGFSHVTLHSGAFCLPKTRPRLPFDSLRDFENYSWPINHFFVKVRFPQGVMTFRKHKDLGPILVITT